jgi:hypothetical protein
MRSPTINIVITSERTRAVLVASSFGYEKPYYRMFVNDQELDPAGTSLSLTLQVQDAAGGWNL